VSHFANGSDYVSVSYADITGFWGFTSKDTENRFTITYPAGRGTVEYDFDLPNDYVQAAQPVTGFKPDFAMTNSGLHIQLPTGPLPAPSFSAISAPRKIQLGWVLADLRFAFLACKLKRGCDLVAVCLQETPRSTFPSYRRVSFDGRSLHHLDSSIYQKYRRPSVTSFTPMWIGKDHALDGVKFAAKLPPSAKRVRFELWYSSAIPVRVAFGNIKSGLKQQLWPRDAFTQPNSLEEQVPNTFRQLMDPVQCYVDGYITIGKFEHEVISFRAKGLAGYANIALGVIDGYMWLDCPLTTTGQHEEIDDTVFEDTRFPTGANWWPSSSAFCVRPDTRGEFRSCFTEGVVTCHGQYVTSTATDSGELLLRISLSPVPQVTRPAVQRRGWYGRLIDAGYSTPSTQ